MTYESSRGTTVFDIVNLKDPGPGQLYVWLEANTTLVAVGEWLYRLRDGSSYSARSGMLGLGIPNINERPSPPGLLQSRKSAGLIAHMDHSRNSRSWTARVLRLSRPRGQMPTNCSVLGLCTSC